MDTTSDRPRTFGFLKTTAIGGLIFLLPLVVVGALLGYVYGVVIVLYEPLKKHLPVSDAGGIAILFGAAILILLAICFGCGFAARRALGQKFSRSIERQIVMLFPKYAIYKDIVAGNIGGKAVTPTLFPVIVRFDESIRIGYESGRIPDGPVIVYLPGSPDPWIGTVALIEPERVRPLAVSFNDTAGICERLGRDSAHLFTSLGGGADEHEG